LLLAKYLWQQHTLFEFSHDVETVKIFEALHDGRQVWVLDKLS
jgi:hypothetical protein